MNWRFKAAIMKICSILPGEEKIYPAIQKRFGRLNANPESRLAAQLEMARWLCRSSVPIEGRTFFEVGTGHKPIVPIGFYLMGIKKFITVDLHRRIDFKILKASLNWMVQHRLKMEASYREFTPNEEN